MRNPGRRVLRSPQLSTVPLTEDVSPARRSPMERRFELLQQRGRRYQETPSHGAPEALAAESVREQRGDDDVRVEDDGHDTILKTSSSV